MSQIIDGTQLTWQVGAFRDYTLQYGTSFYHNLSTNPNRIIATTPVELHGEGAVIETASGWYVQVYGLNADLKYMGSDRFASAASTVTYSFDDVAYIVPCLRTTGGATAVYPSDVVDGLLTITVAGGGCFNE